MIRRKTNWQTLHDQKTCDAQYVRHVKNQAKKINFSFWSSQLSHCTKGVNVYQKASNKIIPSANPLISISLLLCGWISSISRIAHFKEMLSDRGLAARIKCCCAHCSLWTPQSIGKRSENKGSVPTDEQTQVGNWSDWGEVYELSSCMIG
jgi:hypothetical protein